MLTPLLLVIAATAIGGIALYWMWARLREDRTLSADDYVAKSKAQARTDLKHIIRRERGRQR